MDATDRRNVADLVAALTRLIEVRQMRIDEIREWAQKVKEKADTFAESAEQSNARYWCGFSDAMSRLLEQFDVPSSTEEDE